MFISQTIDLVVLKSHKRTVCSPAMKMKLCLSSLHGADFTMQMFQVLSIRCLSNSTCLSRVDTRWWVWICVLAHIVKWTYFKTIKCNTLDRLETEIFNIHAFVQHKSSCINLLQSDFKKLSLFLHSPDVVSVVNGTGKVQLMGTQTE